MNDIDDTATRDVSHCERLILLIEVAHTLFERDRLEKHLEEINWDEIDRLKELCDVLPGKYQEMLLRVERYRDSL